MASARLWHEVPRNVARKSVTIARYVDTTLSIRRQAVHHIVISEVHPRRILLPPASAQMVVAVDAVGLVAHSNAMVNVMLRADLRTASATRPHPPASSLEAVAVASTLKSMRVEGICHRLIAVVGCQTMVYLYRGSTVYQVKAVVAVTPGPAVAKRVARLFHCMYMTAETVNIASIFSF